MKKNIVLIGSGVVSIPPIYGGAVELIIYEISRAMPKDKYDIYVFDRRDGNAQKETISGVVYIRHNVRKFKNIFLMRLTEFCFGVKSLKELRRMQKVDIAHVHTVFTALPLALFKFLLPKSTKLVYTCHNPAWNVTKSEVDFFNGMIKKLEFYIMKKFDSVTTVSDTMVRNIAKAGIPNGKLSRIYNFVNCDEFYVRNKNYWEKRGVKGPVVFFVSKLIQNKGVEYLIRSASIVKSRIPDVKYVVAGPISFEYETDNPWIKLVKDLNLENIVMFTGKVNREDLPYAYSSSDVFCFPTLKEAFGIVLIEAMASGLPVISTDIPVVREITNGDAILVKEKDTEGIAEAVIRVISNKKMRKKLSILSIKRSKAFEKKEIMNQYDKFYRKL